MIRINLLPHREMRRERRKKDFVGLLALTGAAGVAIAIAVAVAIGNQIDAQLARNAFIKAENDNLDAQIKEIALLRQEVEALRARQLAVENLQRDRTLPVQVMDELVKFTPEGIQLRKLKQEGRTVTLTGMSQSNEKVSVLLRSLGQEMQSLERPELIEIKAATLGKPDAKDARRVFEFSVRATIKAPAAAEAQPPARPVAAGAASTAASTAAAAGSQALASATPVNR
ncbi:MAG: PilN domain-containing protein [Burkholderiaceae bacterium]|nr:PilN domain-containing protein [Burkholderiaceae bacterium]